MPAMQGNPAIVAAVRRARQAYLDQVCERAALECGYAYSLAPRDGVATTVPLPEASFVGEFVAQPGEIDQALREIDAHFAASGARCDAIIPAADQPIDALIEPLTRAGYAATPIACVALSPVEPLPPIDPALKILSARSVRRGFERLAAQWVAPLGDGANARVAVLADRLNDSAFEIFVALRDTTPAGMVALHQVGPIARLSDLYVVAESRRRGVARGLISYACATARRWSLRPICAAFPADDAGAGRLFSQPLFDFGGMMAVFRRAEEARIAAWW